MGAAIAYVQFKRPGLEDFMSKKKGKVKLGWRKVVFNLCKDRVRQNSLHKLLKFNRKTVGEDQQRPDVWAEMDPEFDELLATLRHAVEADAHVDVDAIEAKLKEFVLADPDLRKLEQRAREHEAAADEALAAAEALDARRKRIKRLSSASETKASHLPNAVAKRLSHEALAVLERLMKKKAKSIHPRASELNAAGLAECVQAGLAKDAEAHLSNATDRQHAPTAFGTRVYLEALAQDLIAKPKSKRKT